MQIACASYSGLSGTQNVHFFQNIEGYNITRLKWGTEKAIPVTLSFWVRCNYPGIYCVGIENNATDRCNIREYTINPGFKWQKVELTFPGCPDGVWDNLTNTGIRLRFCLGTGDTYNDGVDGQWISLVNPGSMTDDNGDANVMFSVWEDFIGYTITVYCGYTDECGVHYLDSIKIRVVDEE
jgi:hypothetical protein